MDYSILEGKEFQFFNQNVVVAGCEYDIGLTIVNPENKSRLLCLKKSDIDEEKLYSKIFNYIVYCILVYENFNENDLNVVKRFNKDYGYTVNECDNISSNSCAFSN